ncbi:cytidylyltransferase domain-containing protein [Gracilibacillus thailandensis]|uniref:acylneuraminate cytidylyltransferase family protein n=1 Tax=Gracilibacillus thailandensis TaxID=563735 RepID=UPI001969D5A0|nr:acylneuraminate cytidylyltransferase family protein [Gracilibacillus thailandensis]
MKITCFLPCRKGSQRIANKNIRPFSNYQYGLLEIKLNQLAKVQEIDEIILSTNDEEIINYASTLDISNLIVDVRDDRLCSNQTSTDELIEYAGKIVQEGHILWTHVTSPFITEEVYTKAIAEYAAGLKAHYDSLMTVSTINGFIWNEGGPVNYDYTNEKWPRTQTISPLYEINSGIFLASTNVYHERKDRIGDRPLFYETSTIESLDIDWEEDWKIAEAIMNQVYNEELKIR